MAALDGSSGLVPGVLPPSGTDYFTFPSSTRIEVVNDGKARLHVKINPTSHNFTLWSVGSQFVRPGESVEIAVTSTPEICVKTEASAGTVYLVRKLA